MTAKAFLKNYRRVKNAWVPRQRKTATGKRRGPNATEARYRREVLRAFPDEAVAYETRSFTITKTTRREYTPDWTVTTPNNPTAYHEVKGSYKLGSEDRARLAWELAAEQNPGAVFVWAVLTRRGWEIEEWFDGGRSIYVKLPGDDMFRRVQPDWRSHRPRRKARKAKRT